MKLQEGPSELLDVLLCLLCPASLGPDHTLDDPAASGCVVARADTREAPAICAGGVQVLQQQEADEKAEGHWLSSLLLRFCSDDVSSHTGPVRVQAECLERVFDIFKVHHLG